MDYSVSQRQKFAAKGEAQPDGSWPIHNEADLHNAIRAIGRSKNPGRDKAWIKRRAAALGLSKLVPVSWQ